MSILGYTDLSELVAISSNGEMDYLHLRVDLAVEVILLAMPEFKVALELKKG
jgi:hypothetical protein